MQSGVAVHVATNRWRHLRMLLSHIWRHVTSHMTSCYRQDDVTRYECAICILLQTAVYSV